MAIFTSSGIVLLPFADRPAFGSPYPLGMAVGHDDVTGDASGNPITVSFLADGGLLFRLEALNVTRGNVDTDAMNYLTSHRWMTDRSGLGTAAFDLNWVMETNVDATSVFSVSTPRRKDLMALRRLPMGRTDDTVLQTLIAVTISTNTNTVVYGIDVVCSYWRKESLYRPGFLQTFWEAPEVPPTA